MRRVREREREGRFAALCESYRVPKDQMVRLGVLDQAPELGQERGHRGRSARIRFRMHVYLRNFYAPVHVGRVSGVYFIVAAGLFLYPAGITRNIAVKLGNRVVDNPGDRRRNRTLFLLPYIVGLLHYRFAVRLYR